jgi:hypothetical protein
LSNPAHKDQITTDYYNIINWIIWENECWQN